MLPFMAKKNFADVVKPRTLRWNDRWIFRVGPVIDGMFTFPPDPDAESYSPKVM